MHLELKTSFDFLYCSGLEPNICNISNTRLYMVVVSVFSTMPGCLTQDLDHINDW